jgi:hypothetical protein
VAMIVASPAPIMIFFNMFFSFSFRQLIPPAKCAEQIG